MTKIAFLGLGQMGAPMAARLLDAGHDVTVWNRTPDRTRPLTERGALSAATPADAVAGAEVAVTMVSDRHALEDVVFGSGGVASVVGAGQVVVDMSTVGPDAIRSVAERMPEGVDVVDAPVAGSVPQATTGELRIFVGAADGAFERVRDVLEPLGTVRRVGGPGAGAAMKLVVNSTLGAAITALGEALALGRALGLECKALFDVLADSLIGGAARSKRDNVERDAYPPNFKLELALKDLGLVVDAGVRAGRDLMVASAARAWFERAAAEDRGGEDYSAVVATILG